jgi:hypothetical protein
MRKLIQSLVLASLAVSSAAFADDAAAPAPSADEVKKYQAFVEHGPADGFVLVDAKLCGEIPQKGDNAYKCTEELPAEVPAGSKVNIWLEYLMPKNAKTNDGELSVQIKEGDKVRETKDIKGQEGKGWIGHTWTAFTPKKPGNWKAVLMRGDKELKSLSINAGEKK